MREMISTTISEQFQDLKKTLPLSQFKRYGENKPGKAYRIQKTRAYKLKPRQVSKAFEKGIYRRQVEGRCRNCGWPGHWEDTCDEPCGKCHESDQKVSECCNDVFCFYCEEEGHLKGECPRNRHYDLFF
ncbi:hypothetical protein IFM61392_04912 [Aspergillus lentulus]|uniref:CCHC-type domain-containing protein n=1 Tax=Aspergillus lentulus TaxID=293939 RepID=A0ABQ1B3N0_ASPLE|nr:hypothetical protein IFM62136_10206 [Aspergillus lentulus]GFF93135.1 hypothetical protein IFM60648_09982 [Aspergillus lentulus]GFG07544.1 hypothetical protein IFM61392_04912 [Aspergillus lentulus]